MNANANVDEDGKSKLRSSDVRHGGGGVGGKESMEKSEAEDMSSGDTDADAIRWLDVVTRFSWTASLNWKYEAVVPTDLRIAPPGPK